MYRTVATGIKKANKLVIQYVRLPTAMNRPISPKLATEKAQFHRYPSRTVL